MSCPQVRHTPPRPSATLRQVPTAPQVRLWNPHKALMIKNFAAHAHEVLDAVASGPFFGAAPCASTPVRLGVAPAVGATARPPATCVARNHSLRAGRWCHAEDNANIVSVGGDKDVFYWDVATGRVIRYRCVRPTLLPARAAVASPLLCLGVHYSPASPPVAPSSPSPPIRRKLRGHTQRINTCVFGGEGSSVMVTGSYDKTVRVWDCRSRNCKWRSLAGLCTAAGPMQG